MCQDVLLQGFLPIHRIQSVIRDILLQQEARMQAMKNSARKYLATARYLLGVLAIPSLRTSSAVRPWVIAILMPVSADPNFCCETEAPCDSLPVVLSGATQTGRTYLREASIVISVLSTGVPLVAISVRLLLTSGLSQDCWSGETKVSSPRFILRVTLPAFLYLPRRIAVHSDA